MTRKKILIVEDEKNIAKAEGIILGKDHDIHYAEDGEIAMQKAEEILPDVIILDLMLPKRGGYDVCFSLRQHDQLKNSKIIMVTAKNQPIDRAKGMFIGADHYITKPFLPEELREAVRKVLDQ